MRPGASTTKGGVGKVAGAKQIYSLIRGMSIEEIEESVRQPPQLLIVSRESTVDNLIEELTGVRGTPSIVFASPDNLPHDLDQFDLILVNNPKSNEDFLQVRKSAGAAAWRTFDIGPSTDSSSLPSLRDRIAEEAGDSAVSLGRWYPAFRHAAAKSIINDASRANAQFALLASAADFVPVLGSVASAGADIIVLTKNQLAMSIKLAAIYGKPLHNKWDIFRDLIPVVGSGFLWRSAAREAVGFLPFAAGTIPKVAIAFAGTYSVGKGVEAYYRYGEKPSKEQLAGYYKQAMALARSKFPGGKALPETASPPAQAELP